VTTDAPDPSVSVDLPDDSTAPKVARERTRSVLGSWRLPGLLDPLLLVVSELVGNAVRHGRAPIGMLLRRSGGRVRVEVHDEESAAPAGAADLPDDDDECGRGLFLVDAVASETGVEQIPDDGKVVWATLDQDEPASG
jgi:anti-sigma regulatory factor (Ser/Thr protein kinase)